VNGGLSGAGHSFLVVTDEETPPVARRAVAGVLESTAHALTYASLLARRHDGGDDNDVDR